MLPIGQLLDFARRLPSQVLTIFLVKSVQVDREGV